MVKRGRTMQYYEFYRIIAPVIGGGKSQADLTRELFENITKEEAHDLISYSNDTLKGYCRPRGSIGRLAKQVNSYVDFLIFQRYLEEFRAAVEERLYMEFKDYIDALEPENTCEKISELFAEIIHEAAGGKPSKRKTTEFEKAIVKNIGPALSQFAEVLKVNSEQIINPDKQNRISRDCYNLIVCGDGSYFNDSFFMMDRERVITQHYTPEKLVVRFADLSQRAIDELCRFPSLFVPEADGYHCKIGEDQTAYLGLITKVKARDDEFKIYWEKVKRFDLKLLSGYAFDLGFKDVDSAVSELNRTHWAVKQIDLIAELQEIGINFFE